MNQRRYIGGPEDEHGAIAIPSLNVCAMPLGGVGNDQFESTLKLEPLL
jgi:hypothetical protein